jgi:hypothetical protein
MTRDVLIAKINADPSDVANLRKLANLCSTEMEAQSWWWIIDNGRRPLGNGSACQKPWFWFRGYDYMPHSLPLDFYSEANEITDYFSTPFKAYEALVAAIVRIGFPDGPPVKQKPNECGREEFSLASQADIESMRENEEQKITYVYLDKMSFWEWLHIADFSVVSRAKERAKKIAGVTAIGLGLVVCTVLCVLVVGAGIIGLLNLIPGVKP